MKEKNISLIIHEKGKNPTHFLLSKKLIHTVFIGIPLLILVISSIFILIISYYRNFDPTINNSQKQTIITMEKISPKTEEKTQLAQNTKEESSAIYDLINSISQFFKAKTQHITNSAIRSTQDIINNNSLTSNSDTSSQYQELKIQLEEEKKNNELLQQRLSGNDSSSAPQSGTASGQEILNLFNNIKSMQNLQTQKIFQIDQFSCIKEQGMLKVSFNIVNTTLNQEKISGHVLVFAGANNYLFVHPATISNIPFKKINFYNGEAFATSRFRPVEASFPVANNFDAKIINTRILIFSKTGDLLLNVDKEINTIQQNGVRIDSQTSTLQKYPQPTMPQAGQTLPAQPKTEQINTEQTKIGQ